MVVVDDTVVWAWFAYGAMFGADLQHFAVPPRRFPNQHFAVVPPRRFLIFLAT
jgi:hypothetical protein